MSGVRVVLAGKGGVGKSTLSALVARSLARRGRRVVAVDGDEQSNLGPALGVDAVTASARALSRALDYVTERAGGAGLVRLNPDARDAVDRLGVDAPDGVRLLTLGAVTTAGGGCLCPQTSLLAAAVADLALRDEDVVVLDTHAGVEHFGRALARGFNRALVVATPSASALDVAERTASLAADLGIGSIGLVVNQCRDADAGAWASATSLLWPRRPDATFLFPYDNALDGASASVGPALASWPLTLALSPVLDWLDARVPAVA